MRTRKFDDGFISPITLDDYIYPKALPIKNSKIKKEFSFSHKSSYFNAEQSFDKYNNLFL